MVILLLTGGRAYGAQSTPVTLQVGPNHALKQPSAAARLARNGDIIQIEAGNYLNDYATWNQSGLTIRGVNGMAHLKSTGLIPNGKAIWIVAGDNTVVENIEFSGAAVADTNGAGIRHEGGSLTLRNTFFHHNEFSILTGKKSGSSLTIEASKFWFQKRANTFSHGIYVGALEKFTITGSHIKGTHRGHQIKSRALENHILYNRIEDIAEGNSSRLIDLPNCGTSFIMGNDLHQAATTQNSDAIGFGAEDCSDRTERQMQLYVVNNTFVNEALSGTLVKNHTSADVLIANNLIMGRGFTLLGRGTKRNNVRVSIARHQVGSWVPAGITDAIDAAQALPSVEGIVLLPTRKFEPPVGASARVVIEKLDVGSREFSAN